MNNNLILKSDKIFKHTLTDILKNGTSTVGHKIRPKYKDYT